jgi:hypothetical protein
MNKTKIIKILAWAAGITADFLWVYCFMFGLWVESLILFCTIIYIGVNLDRRAEAEGEKNGRQVHIGK